MRRILLTCLLLTGVVYTAQAQSKQYVVKLSGDTIRGKIMINPVRDNSRSMFFKGDDGFKGNISPLRYTYVYYNDKTEYRSVVFLNQKLFMQIIFEGERVGLYNYVHHRDNSIVNSRVAIKSDGDGIELSALTFKNQMKDFVDDCPEVVAKMDTKEFRFRNHRELFEAYENCQAVYTITPTAASQSAPPSNPQPTEEQNVSQPVATPTPTPAAVETNMETSSQIKHLADFRDFVNGIEDYAHKQDILDLLVDLENRVKQNDGIPNYLWSSLQGMVFDHEELTQKTKALKLALSPN